MARSQRRGGSPLCAALLAGALCAGLGAASVARAATRQATTYYVDTTQDGEENPSHCQGREPCSLRSAVKLADENGGGTVTARLCATGETVGCLSTADRGYDEATGRWVFKLSRDLGALELVAGNTTIDFVSTVPGWSGPGDNRVVVEGSGTSAQGFSVQGTHQTIRGIDFRGEFRNAAIEVHTFGHQVTIGPGVVVAGLTARAGIRLRDPDVSENKVIGTWCGITGPDEDSQPMTGDCIVVDEGAHENTIGGEGNDANVVAAATGRGIVLAGTGSDRNVVAHNLVGATARGPARIDGPGIAIDGGGANQIEANTVLSSGATALRVSGQSFGNVIHGNDIGYDRAHDALAGSAGWGIELRDTTKATDIQENDIRGNAGGGVLVTGNFTQENLITRNVITQNGGPGIRVSGGANNGAVAPQWSIVRANQASGTACAGCTVDVYSDAGDEGAFFEGSVIATLGAFIFDKPEGFRGPNLTATATRSRNTSSLSAPAAVPGVATATPPVEPTAPTGGYVVTLPWAAKDAAP